MSTWVQSLSWEDLLDKGMAAHSSILAWRIPWTEEPSGLQSIRSQKVGHNRTWLKWLSTHTKQQDQPGTISLHLCSLPSKNPLSWSCTNFFSPDCIVWLLMTTSNLTWFSWWPGFLRHQDIGLPSLTLFWHTFLTPHLHSPGPFGTLPRKWMNSNKGW